MNLKKTKIVCTLGPACADEGILEQMLLSGMNVARINFSHGTHAEHAVTIDRFRAVRDRLGLPAAVMLDTKGPEIRLGMFSDSPVTLSEGDPFTLTTRVVEGDRSMASVTYADLPKRLHPGNTILIDDGQVTLRVESIDQTDIVCTVVYGGPVSNRKGINVPRVSLGLPYLSESDKADLRFGVEHDVDYIAASFIRSKEDVIALRRYIDYHGGHDIKIISKIENGEGVEHFDEILSHSDGIMVARGDMGVEVEFERLPGIQKRFIRKCYQSGKMVITATQMLESMVSHPNPTRAEITDVANAVFDGTSAVMLSGESAIGQYPLRAVKTMARIALQAEKDAFSMNNYGDMAHVIDHDDVPTAICDAACTTARDIAARALIAVTKRGETARKMSKFRPFEPIVAATLEKKTFHQLALSWGVYPVMSIRQADTEQLFAHAVECAKQLDIAKDGDRVVIALGIPLGISGNTNILRVHQVGAHNQLL